MNGKVKPEELGPIDPFYPPVIRTLGPEAYGPVKPEIVLPEEKNILEDFLGPISSSYELPEQEKEPAVIRVDQPPSYYETLPEGKKKRLEMDAAAARAKWETAIKARSHFGDWAANHIFGYSPEYIASLPDRPVPREYYGVIRSPEGKWINAYGQEVPEPPKEFLEQAEEPSSIQKVGQFAFGDYLGRPEYVAEMILSGDPSNMQEAIRGVASDLMWWAPFVGPLKFSKLMNLTPTMKASNAFVKTMHRLKGSKAFAESMRGIHAEIEGLPAFETLEEVARTGVMPPRLIHRALQNLIPPAFKPNRILEGLWENIIVPPFHARFIPSYGEGAKSLAEVFQPAVERLQKIPFGYGTMASPIRNKMAQEGAMADVAKDLGQALGHAKPSLRYEVARSFASNTEPASKEAKELFQAYNKKVGGAHLRKTYDFYYQKGIKDALKRHTVGSGPQWEMYETHPGVDEFLNTLDESLRGVFEPKKITKTLKKTIENPTIPRGLRELARDLYDLPLNSVEAVAEASRYAGRHFLFDRLQRMGVVKNRIPEGEKVSDWMISKIPELKQAWLPRDVELELRAMETIPKISRGMFNKFFMTPWKVTRLMLRPATHFRNLLSNAILNDWGGLPFYRMDYYAKGMKDMLSLGPHIRQWGKLTGGGGSFTKSELAQISHNLKYSANSFDHCLALFDRITAPAKSLYNAEEQWAKITKFIWNKEHEHMSPLEAATDAMKWCVDDKTEILTNKGWKTYHELHKGNLCLQYDPEKETCTWLPVKGKYVGPYKGDMIEVTHPRVSMLLTPDHTCPRRRRSHMGNPMCVDKALQLLERYQSIVPVAAEGVFQGKDIHSLDFWELVGWFISDRQTFWIQEPLRSELLSVCPRKKIRNIDLANLSREQAQALFDGLMKENGSADGKRWFRKDIKDRQMFQALCCMLGIQGSFSSHGRDQVYLNSSKDVVILRNKHVKRVRYEGIIWCPETHTGFWFARRKGKVFITGNTFNYGEVTRATARIRGFAAPFFTWQSKVLPLMAETAVKHPVRFFKWIGMYEALQQYALNTLNISDSEWEYIKRTLPEYIREGQFLLVPWRDQKGRLQLLNLTYMIPGFGDLNEISVNPVSWFISNPIWSAAGAITSKTRFSGAPLYYDWEKPNVKAMKTLSYIWQQFAPTWVPGGVDWDKMWDTVQNHPDALTYEQILAMNLGLKIAPIDVTKAARKRDILERIHGAEMASEMKRELRTATNPSQAQSIVKKYQRYRVGLED